MPRVSTARVALRVTGRRWFRRLSFPLLACALCSVAFEPCVGQNIGVVPVAQLPVGGDLANKGIPRLERAPGRPSDLFAAQIDGTMLRIDLTDNSVIPLLRSPMSTRIKFWHVRVPWLRVSPRLRNQR